MKNIITTLLLAVLVLSCSKKDKENPSISVAMPTNHSYHMTGEHFMVQAYFSDNEQLNSFHIFLNENNNGTGSSEEVFEFDTTGTFTAPMDTIMLHIMVPANADTINSYNLMIAAMDEAGNAADTVDLMLHFTADMSKIGSSHHH